MNCAGCHAYDLTGGMGPDLTDNSWLYGGKPGEIYHTIAEGTPRGMPAWKDKMTRTRSGRSSLTSRASTSTDGETAMRKIGMAAVPVVGLVGSARAKSKTDKSPAFDIVKPPMDQFWDRRGMVSPSFWAFPMPSRPVGDLRWMPPQPVAKWTGVRSAYQVRSHLRASHHAGAVRRAAEQQ